MAHTNKEAKKIIQWPETVDSRFISTFFVVFRTPWVQEKYDMLEVKNKLSYGSSDEKKVLYFL